METQGTFLLLLFENHEYFSMFHTGRQTSTVDNLDNTSNAKFYFIKAYEPQTPENVALPSFTMELLEE